MRPGTATGELTTLISLPPSLPYPILPLSLLLSLQVSAQVNDLRSAVSKEGCKTVAVLAFALRQHFVPLVEFLVPAMLKQSLVKIQVMSAAADKSLRIAVVSCCSSHCGEGKLLPVLMDACANKAAAVRRMAAELLALSCALAKTESLER